MMGKLDTGYARVMEELVSLQQRYLKLQQEYGELQDKCLEALKENRNLLGTALITTNQNTELREALREIIGDFDKNEEWQPMRRVKLYDKHRHLVED